MALDRKRLEQLLTFHQQRADAIKITLELLDEDAGKQKLNGTQSLLRQAIQMDEERRKPGRPGKVPDQPPPPDTGTVRDKVRARRALTAQRLAAMSRTEPRQYGHGTSVLLLHGYLAKKGDGYVLTNKKFEAVPS